MIEVDIDLFIALIEESQPVPVDLESRLLAQGIDTQAIREIHEPQ